MSSLINNFDLGIDGLACQIYRESHNSNAKLMLYACEGVSNGFFVPASSFTLFGKEALVKLRDVLIKEFPPTN